MKEIKQCSNCRFFKPFVQWKLGSCYESNKGTSKVYDQTCDKWTKGKNR